MSAVERCAKCSGPAVWMPVRLQLISACVSFRKDSVEWRWYCPICDMHLIQEADESVV